MISISAPRIGFLLSLVVTVPVMLPCAGRSCAADGSAVSAVCAMRPGPPDIARSAARLRKLIDLHLVRMDLPWSSVSRGRLDKDGALLSAAHGPADGVVAVSGRVSR